MAEATELTYENMKEMVETYYRIVSEGKGPEDESRLRELFTPDFEARKRAFNGETGVIGREQWIKGSSGPNRWKIDISWDKPPYGMIIDVKQGKVLMLYKDTFKNPPMTIDPPGIKVSEISFCTIWELCIHENKVKAKSEYIMHPSMDPLFW